jgi:hypothetical protein
VHLILQDVYQYLAYWFSQWLSPITSVAATAKWLSSGQNGAAGLTDLQVSKQPGISPSLFFFVTLVPSLFGVDVKQALVR